MRQKCVWKCENQWVSEGGILTEPLNREILPGYFRSYLTREIKNQSASNHSKSFPYYRTPPINAQCQSMPIKIMALIRNVSQCWSLPIGIDRHWSELIDIGINARILIGIDRHWSALGIDPGSPVQVIVNRCSLFNSSKENTNLPSSLTPVLSYNMHTVIEKNFHVKRLCPVCKIVIPGNVSKIVMGHSLHQAFSYETFEWAIVSMSRPFPNTGDWISCWLCA